MYLENPSQTHTFFIATSLTHPPQQANDMQTNKNLLVFLMESTYGAWMLWKSEKQLGFRNTESKDHLGLFVWSCPRPRSEPLNNPMSGCNGTTVTNPPWICSLKQAVVSWQTWGSIRLCCCWRSGPSSSSARGSCLVSAPAIIWLRSMLLICLQTNHFWV